MAEPQTPTTDAEKQKLVDDAAKASAGVKDGENASKAVGKPTDDEFLTMLNTTLKRNFTSRDEAVKSLDNLNRMVGDNALAELRKQAEDGKNFDAVVHAYAKNEGKTPEVARKELLDEIAGQKTQTPPAQTNSGSSGTDSDKRLRALELELQEERLLKTHPEAKNVLKEVKDLSNIYVGQTLTAIYEGSSLKDMATKAETYDKEKSTKSNTAVQSNTRQVSFADEDLKKAIDNMHKTGFDSDKQALVEAFIKKAGA